jgi:hypothetical protein
MKPVHFPEVEARTIIAFSPTLIHHHTTISFLQMNPRHLAHFSFAVAPREIPVHLWASNVKIYAHVTENS